jgi:hypothetical protein
MPDYDDYEEPDQQVLDHLNVAPMMAETGMMKIMNGEVDCEILMLSYRSGPTKIVLPTVYLCPN